MNDTQTILIVEDSDDDFLATTRALEKASFANPVQRCRNGDQVFDYLYQRGEFASLGHTPRPGIILLDLNLPGTNGREILRMVKSDPHLQQIPVIILTTSYARQDIERCYDAGADSYVQKPVDFAGFVEVIARIKKNWLEAEAGILPEENE